VTPPCRIAFLVKRFPRLSETFVLNEFLELRRQGLDLRLYSLSDPQEPLTHPEAAALVGEVCYLHDPRRPLRSWRRLLVGAFAQMAANPAGAGRVGRCWLVRHRSRASLRHAVEGLWLARELQRHGVAHLHAHFAHSPSAVAHMCNLAGGPPFSFTAHAKDLYTTPARRVTERAADAAFVVTCTNANRHHLAALHAGQRVHVVYHGTDTSRFHPDGRRPEPGRILSVGRLVPKKGFDCLVDALGILASRRDDFRCEIVGGGPLREPLEHRIAAGPLRSLVQIHGSRLQEEILGEYRRAGLFVLAPLMTEDGDRDGIPNVLVEAMACGVPVVSTRLSGIPELIEHGREGLLVEPGDAAGLADAIDLLLSDPELARSFVVAGRRKVERLFDVRRNTASLADLLAPARVTDRPRELVRAG
jgi:glycosyltransferase involved in cell wall biosynthesis